MNSSKKKKFHFDAIFQDKNLIFDIQDNTVHRISRHGAIDALEGVNIPIDCLSKCADLEWYNTDYDTLCRTEVEGHIFFSVTDKTKKADITLEYKTLPRDNHPPESDSKDVGATSSSTTSTNAAVKRKSCHPSTICVTEYNPKPMEYIKKQSGILAKENRKKKKGTNKVTKHHHIDTKDSYIPSVRVNTPQNCLCSIMSLTGQEYRYCLSFKNEVLHNKGGGGNVYWTAIFNHDKMDLLISSYNDVEFCFNKNNATTKN
eukprot:7920366-Ditylum_brightwellii.AAC.1